MAYMRLRRGGLRGLLAALGTMWTLLAAAEPHMQVPSAPEGASHPLMQHWLAAWQRQPEAASETAWRQAAQARQETAGQWTAGPMALELSAKTDQFHQREGAREYEAGIAIPLWRPGERAALARWAQAENQADASRISAARLRTARQVRRAWWDWQRARAEQMAAQDRLDSAKALALDTSRRLRAGDLAPADLNQANGAVALARAVLLQAQSQETARRTALQAISGITPMASQAVLAMPEPMPDDILTGTPAQLDRALNTHPELLALQHQAAAARRHAERVATQKRSNPEVTLSTTRARDQRSDAFGQTVTLGLRIPFGADNRHTEQWASAHALALEASAALAARRDQLLADMHAAQAQALVTRAQWQAAIERERLAQQTRNFYQKSFALGETDMPTLLRMEEEAIEAQRHAALAAVEHATAISMLLQALGYLPQSPAAGKPVMPDEHPQK